MQFDIQKNLHIVYLLPRPTQDRIISIIRQQRFQDWLINPNSSILYLNGNNTPTAPSRQSPTAFVCAKVISAIQSASQEDTSPNAPFRTIALSFFCAEHMDPHDSHLDAVQILHNLLPQLLFHYRDFDPTTILELRDSELDNLNTLCHTFITLIEQLPPQIILFCIIDAITLHEESKIQRPEIEKLLACLSNLVNDDREELCRVKVLLTSPRVSRRLWKRLGQDDVVTLPEKIVSQGGFTAAKWNGYMRDANESYFS